MDVQRHYWDTFSNLKRDAMYLNRYQSKVESADRAINIFFAIASSTSIAGWAIWQQYAFIWGVITAASQVLTAAKPFLPYRARLKGLNGLAPDVDALALAAEADWFKVSKGLMTEAEIYDLAMPLKRKEQPATQKHFKDSSLPENRTLLILADQDATAYMSSLTEE